MRERERRRKKKKKKKEREKEEGKEMRKEVKDNERSERRRLELGVEGRKPSGFVKTETEGRKRWENRELTVFTAKARFRRTPRDGLIHTVLRWSARSASAIPKGL